jgi:hypothetical protein
MDSCGIAQDLIVHSALAQALIAESAFARDLISDGACVRHAFLGRSIADDFPDPWGFSDCEDGLI